MMEQGASSPQRGYGRHPFCTLPIYREVAMNTSERDSHAEPCQTADNGRDAQGRFAPGNLGGPGNPYARRVAELRRVMLDCVTAQDMEIIVGELMVQAKNGKLGAIKLLFQYVLGKPPATVNPDTLDLEEVDLFRRSPMAAEATDVLANRLPPGPVAEVLRFAMPCVGDRFQQELAEGLQADLAARRRADEAERAGESGPAATPDARPAPSPNGKNGTPERPRPAPSANDTRPESTNDTQGRRDFGAGPAAGRV